MMHKTSNQTKPSLMTESIQEKHIKTHNIDKINWTKEEDFYESYDSKAI